MIIINFIFFKQEGGSTSAQNGKEGTTSDTSTRDETPAEGDGRNAEIQEVIILPP